MIDKLDCSVGALLHKLDELGIAENTLVLFTSDNGHEPSYYRSATKQEDKKILSSNLGWPYPGRGSIWRNHGAPWHEAL
jgi:arylsulfatase A-like enzyme